MLGYDIITPKPKGQSLSRKKDDGFLKCTELLVYLQIEAKKKASSFEKPLYIQIETRKASIYGTGLYS